MIRLEGGVLVLDAPISKKDAEAVGEFAKHVREQEQERIINLIEEDTRLIGTWQRDESRIYRKAIERAIELIKGETNE